jgi:hypothetical protein
LCGGKILPIGSCKFEKAEMDRDAGQITVGSRTFQQHQFFPSGKRERERERERERFGLSLLSFMRRNRFFLGAGGAFASVLCLQPSPCLKIQNKQKKMNEKQRVKNERYPPHPFTQIVPKWMPGGVVLEEEEPEI